MRHIECDVLRAEGVPSAKCDRQFDLPQRNGLPVGHATEGGQRGELALPDLHSAEYFQQQQVEACTAVHQGPSDPDVADGGHHDDREEAHARRVGGVVAPVESDGSARPLERLGAPRRRGRRANLPPEELRLPSG